MKTTNYIIIIPPIWLAAMKCKALTVLAIVLFAAAVLFACAGMNGLIRLGVGLAGAIVCAWGSMACVNKIERNEC
jgi:hypothetical protein